MHRQTSSSEPDTRTAIEVYSWYERLRGGILLVMQGALLLGQTLVAPRIQHGTVWSPAYLLPLYLAYFVTRGPVWRAAYRRRGHLDSAVGRRGAQIYMYLVTAGLPVMMVMTWSRRSYDMGIPVSWGVAWALGYWAVVTVLGVLPLDYVFYYGHWLILDRILRASPLPADWIASSNQMLRVLAVGMIAVGLYQHRQFKESVDHGDEEDQTKRV